MEGIPPAKGVDEAKGGSSLESQAERFVGEWDSAAAAYEDRYLAAVAGMPASKRSGRMTARDRAEFDALMAAGQSVDDLVAVVAGMVLEVEQGNRWRLDTPKGGFWHALVFRADNRVKFGDMWRRQSAALEAGAVEADRLRSRFGRLG